ncbi:HTH-type transcriptional activator CmpR [compost metagenome]
MYQYNEWFRSFHTVARTGSFALAAEYLSVGRPTVSEQVSALEEKFAVELFHRDGRRFELSPVGRQLFAITQGLFEQEELAVQVFTTLGQHKKEALRLGAVSPPVAMNIIYSFMQRHPEIELETSFNTERATLERLINLDIDAAILAHSDFDPRLDTQLYRRYPIVAVVRDDHPWARLGEVSIRQISGERLVLRESQSRTRQRLEDYCLQHGVTLNCVMQLNSREAITHAIMQNIGIGFVSAVEYVELPGTCAISFIDEPLQIEYYLCCLRICRQRPLIEKLFNGASAV